MKTTKKYMCVSAFAIFSAALIIAAPAWAVTFNSPVTIAEGNSIYDGQDIVVSGCVVTINGEHTFASLSIENNGTVTHAQPFPLYLTIEGDALIESGSAINITGCGHIQNTGPGTGSVSGGGAGYGGEGGYSRHGSAGGTAYGSMTEPDYLGSGGANSGYGNIPGGAGGGLIRLAVSGTLTINGVISANGVNGGVNDYYDQSQGGGGSGGSIWLISGNITGSGSITANGGSSLGTWSGIYGGGGSGGRIALYYTLNTFSGTISANGGTGASNGGAGTIYRKGDSDTCGQLLLSNGGVTAGWTPLPSSLIYDAVISDGAVVYTSSPVTLSELTIQSGGTVSIKNGIPIGVNLTVLGNAAINSGAFIITDGKGHGQNTGPGAGSISGGGAGYGGEGGYSGHGSAGGAAYGSMAEPYYLGSGGANSGYGNIPGGAGGGLIRLAVSGTLTINGVISANGVNGGVNDYYDQSQGGGGSGGSIWLTADTLAGTGSITANGGSSLGTWSGIYGGGGGGGRIALYYTLNTFSGTISANGGTGASNGGTGTIYRKGNSDNYGQLLVSNGGISAGWTPMPSSLNYDAVISNGALVYTPDAVTLSELVVHSGGTISHKDVAFMGVKLTVLGNAVIDAGGTIVADGKGYRQQSGPGAGYEGGTGAGYGGAGGRSKNTAAVGAMYGSQAYPVHLGSGGGNAGYGGVLGGVGGGAIQLFVSGTLTLNGTLSANGTDGGINYAYSESQGGGGSGGSIWITADTLAGTGTITANGGIAPGTWPEGEYRGRFAGGGGGGRIAIYSTDMTSFTPASLSVNGGIGYVWGMNGSIYISGEIPVIAGDANYSGRVDLGDFEILSNHWGTGSVPPPTWGQGNFNGDSMIGIDDLLILAENWLAVVG